MFEYVVLLFCTVLYGLRLQNIGLQSHSFTENVNYSTMYCNLLYFNPAYMLHSQCYAALLFSSKVLLNRQFSNDVVIEKAARVT